MTYPRESPGGVAPGGVDARPAQRGQRGRVALHLGVDERLQRAGGAVRQGVDDGADDRSRHRRDPSGAATDVGDVVALRRVHRRVRVGGVGDDAARGEREDLELATVGRGLVGDGHVAAVGVERDAGDAVGGVVERDGRGRVARHRRGDQPRRARGGVDPRHRLAVTAERRGLAAADQLARLPAAEVDELAVGRRVAGERLPADRGEDDRRRPRWERSQRRDVALQVDAHDAVRLGDERGVAREPAGRQRRSSPASPGCAARSRRARPARRWSRCRSAPPPRGAGRWGPARPTSPPGRGR